MNLNIIKELEQKQQEKGGFIPLPFLLFNLL
jgi:hypothetical protein